MKLLRITITTLALTGALLHAQDNDGKKKPGIDLEAAKAFHALDKNRDGEVDRREFAQSEMAQRARSNGQSSRLESMYQRIDKNDDGTISVFEFAESSQNRQSELMDRATQRRFDDLDRNSDGVIGRREFSQSSVAEMARKNGKEDKIGEIFEKFDLNDNGDIGPFEFAQAHDQKEKPKMEPDHLAERFAKLDANDDGSIEDGEFAAFNKAPESRVAVNEERIRKAFDGMDENGNGELSPQEFTVAHAGQGQLLGRGEEHVRVDPEVLDAFRETDRNDDKSLSKREFERGPFAERARDSRMVTHMFERMDRNDDREISLKEYSDARKGPPGRGKGKGKGPGKGDGPGGGDDDDDNGGDDNGGDDNGGDDNGGDDNGGDDNGGDDNGGDDNDGDNEGGPILPTVPFDYAGVQLPDHYLTNALPGGQPSAISLDNTPRSNPTTNEGATLGRVLFYDEKLSANGTISCASCHRQENGFSDPNTLSFGFDGGTTRRHSMALANARFYGPGKFFLDERAATLEEQVLMPFQDPVEMGLSLSELEAIVDEQFYYPDLFTAAFGDDEVTSDRIARALAQFVRSIVSIDSAYDRGRAMDGVNRPTDPFPNFTAEENLGKDLFMIPDRANGRSGCVTCHVSEAFVGTSNNRAPNATTTATNIGLDAVSTTDLGIAETTGNPADEGKFKVPSLKNIAMTAPYMHDGRFATLAEVVGFYNTGIQPHENLAPRLRDEAGEPTQMDFSEEEIDALVAFLRTLTDETLLNDEKFSDPF